MERFAELPAAIAIGKLVPVELNPVPVTVAPVTVRAAPPGLEITNVFVNVVLTTILPKLIELGESEI